MRIRPSLIFVLGFFCATSASAWELALVSGPNYSHPSLNPDPPVGTSVSTRAGLDFGALTAFSLGGDYLFETGLIRHSRSTVAEDASAKLELRYSGWLIPAGFRFMRADFFGFGFGPYLAVLGKRTKGSLTPTGGTSVDFEGDDPDRKGYEIGLRVNLRLAFPAPVYPTAKIILDGSYLFGFTDLNKSGVAEDKTQDLLVLVGVQIPFGSDATEPAPEASPSPIPKPETKTKEKRK